MTPPAGDYGNEGGISTQAVRSKGTESQWEVKGRERKGRGGGKGGAGQRGRS